MKKMNIKGVFQIWMKNGDYHEVPLKECHAWTREGCKMCPDFAAEHADISTGGIGKFNDWTLTIVRTDLGREIMERMLADGCDRGPARRRRPRRDRADAQARRASRASAGPSSPSTHRACSPRRDHPMILRPDRLRDFAQRPRDVVDRGRAGRRRDRPRRCGLRDPHHRPPRLGPGLAGLARGRRARGRPPRWRRSTLRYLAFRHPPGLADAWLKAFHDPDHDLDVRAGPGGVLASMLTIGFGGAMGLEGLSIFAGGTVGTFVQRRMGWLFRPVDNKVLMTAGAAAGVAAIFKAPATGALFAIEVPFADDFAHRKLLPCLVAAATGYLGFAVVNGTEPLFAVHRHGSFDTTSIVGALALGLVAGLGARAFAWMLAGAKRIVATVALPTRIVGAAIASAALLLAGRAATGRDLMLGPGYDVISWATRPDRAIWLLLLVMLLRCLATGVDDRRRWRGRAVHPARGRGRAARSRRGRRWSGASTTRCSSSSASPRSSAPATASRSPR